MCLPPLAIAAVALMAAGGGMKYLGAKKADHALYNTFNAERTRQKAFQADQLAAFKDSLNSTQQVADPNAEAVAANKRAAVLSSVIKPAAAPGSYLPGSSSAPAVVAADAKAQGSRADAHVSALAQALGALGGVGDMMQANNINIGHNSQKIGQLGSFMNGSLGVLQSEMDAAKRKGGNLRMLGGLAQSIGQAMMAGSGGGIPSPDIAAPMTVNMPSVAPAMFLSSSPASLPSFAI